MSVDCRNIVAQENKAENLSVLSCSDVDSVAPIDCNFVDIGRKGTDS